MECDLLEYGNRFKHFYRQRFAPLAEQLGLTQLEIDILLFLHNHPACRAARDIIEVRGLSKSNVSTAVESLRAAGWLTVLPDPASRRSKLLLLCPERQAEMTALAQRQRECMAVPTQGFTPEETATLHALWCRMDDNIRRAALQDKEA